MNPSFIQTVPWSLTSRLMLTIRWPLIYCKSYWVTNWIFCNIWGLPNYYIKSKIVFSRLYLLFVHVYVCSPEQKAQVSFSDHNLFVVHRCCPHRSCRCKLFTFSSSSPDSLGQFQPNLAQSILGWRGFKIVQMKCQTLFLGEIITK